MSKILFKGTPVNTTVPKKYFPAGITQLTLFDSQGLPVCERLVFIHPDETEKQTRMEVTPSGEGNNMEYKIRIRNMDGKPVRGNVALAVAENLSDSVSPGSGNILSSLLLTSDLQGKVAFASEYFNEKNPEARLNLDYVMLVNGWRRFIWKEVLAGKFPHLFFSPSMGISSDQPVSGIALQPASLNFTEKAFFSPLNEQYDLKLVRKNTREAAKKNMPPAMERNVNSVFVNQNTASSFSNMVEYMKGRVAGVAVTESGITIRGINSINSGTDPLILQDNTTIQFHTLKTISPRDVTSVEILKGPDSSIYGARGANGVIIIHMKTGQEAFNETRISTAALPATENVFTFYKAREYYVPAYDSWNHKPSDYNVPKTVFWNPAIEVDTAGAVVRFKTADVNKLKTTVEGIAEDGSVLYYEE
jgi:TonB-dependent SusC/RagA subfamily outer membrane receptor